MRSFGPGLGVLLALLVLPLAGRHDDDGGVLIAVSTGGLGAVFVDCPDCRETVTLRGYGRYPLRRTDPNVANFVARCGFVVATDPTSTRVPRATADRRSTTSTRTSS
jgi:hypothetical protein